MHPHYVNTIAHSMPILIYFEQSGMDYNISLEDEKDVYEPEVKNAPTSFNSEQYQNYREAETTKPLETQEEKRNVEYVAPVEGPTGVTKFCQLQFYEQYFRATQLDVTERIKLSFYPLRHTFIESLGHNPDLYGPFWILTTIVFLLSCTGNLSRYFYNWEKIEYIFKLELVRYGVSIVYPIGLGFPLLLHFVIKVISERTIDLAQLICIYGYSFSCFIPIFLLCILPVPVLQWLLIAYGMVNTTAFLVLNLKPYLEDQKAFMVVSALIVGVQLTLFLTFKLVFFKMVYESED